MLYVPATSYSVSQGHVRGTTAAPPRDRMLSSVLCNTFSSLGSLVNNNLKYTFMLKIGFCFDIVAQISYLCCLFGQYECFTCYTGAWEKARFSSLLTFAQRTVFSLPFFLCPSSFISPSSFPSLFSCLRSYFLSFVLSFFLSFCLSVCLSFFSS